jgi:glycosyltransferase involved in cell wall biosynthesis
MVNINVVWICHFSNEGVRKKLPLSKMIFLNFLRKVFGNRNKTDYSDFAPWVTNQIKEFEKFSNIKLHVIAPHCGLKRFTYEFELNGIYYHFYKPELFFLLKKIGEKLFKKWQRKFRLNRYFVKKFIKNINPDIVNLIGTENPYYSITTLDIKDIPVYVTVQTVYTNPNWKKFSGEYDSAKGNLERKIHEKEKYYGCWGWMYRDLILNNNPNAIIFRNSLPKQKPVGIKEVPKEYDFVFFSVGVTLQKGIEDAIDALALVKKEKPDVTLNVVGDCNVNYKNILMSKITTLGLNDNIFFNDYFPILADMHQHVKKSKFAILPNKLDVLSNTVIESMLLGLPLTTYKTNGTPYLNKDGETVLLADIGDIKKLAENMLKLLNSSELAEKLRKDAKAFVEREFDNTYSAKRLVKIYGAVIDHYHDKIPIPKELLFNLNESPVYKTNGVSTDCNMINHK